MTGRRSAVGRPRWAVVRQRSNATDEVIAFCRFELVAWLRVFVLNRKHIHGVGTHFTVRPARVTDQLGDSRPVELPVYDEVEFADAVVTGDIPRQRPGGEA